MSVAPDKREADTDALAARAAAGNAQALADLWTLHRGLLFLLCRRWYNRHRDTAAAHGLTLDDLDQEAFFVLKYAADYYVPDRGAFSTALGLAFKAHIRRVLLGDHTRLIQDADGRPARVSGNPLNDCISLDEVPPGEEDARPRVEMIEDPAALAAFDHIEDRDYIEQLHAALDDVLATLNEREALIVRGRYFEGKTLSELGAELGKSNGYISHAERAALEKLSHKRWRLRQFHVEITGRVYGGTGLDAWKNSGSVEERIAEILDAAGLLAPRMGSEIIPPAGHIQTI